MRTFTSIAAVCTTALVAVSGCSSVSGTAVSEPPSAPESTTAPASTAAPISPPRQLGDYLPQLQDVPVGFVVVPIPQDRLGDEADKVAKASEIGVVTPAECQGDVTAASITGTEKSGLANVTTNQLIIGIAAPEPGYIDRFRQYNLGPCARVERTGVANGNGFTGRSLTQLIGVDTPGIEGALTVRHDTSGEMQIGEQRPETTFVALLPVEGGTIVISQSVMLSSDVPDIEVFKSVVAAVARRATGK